MKITKSKLRQIIKEELEGEQKQIIIDLLGGTDPDGYNLGRDPDQIFQALELMKAMGAERELGRNRDLADVSFSGMDFSGQDLSNFNFYMADFYEAKMVGTNLSNAILEYATLTHADLTNADLTNADLSHANLSYANLTGAKLDGAKFYETEWDEEDTIWPDGFVPPRDKKSTLADY
tara:strand:- start:2152 stop:2682 length:531 start_codon:yes stop_codon:yes gene_type:complete